MPSYKISNKPRMYFCTNNVVCSIHASLLLDRSTSGVLLQKLFEHTFTKQLCPSIYIRNIYYNI